MTETDKLYQATMAFARKLLEKGMLTESEYTAANAFFISLYSPSSGTLFADIDLIKQELYGNIRH